MRLPTRPHLKRQSGPGRLWGGSRPIPSKEFRYWTPLLIRCFVKISWKTQLPNFSSPSLPPAGHPQFSTLKVVDGFLLEMGWLQMAAMYKHLNKGACFYGVAARRLLIPPRRGRRGPWRTAPGSPPQLCRKSQVTGLVTGRREAATGVCPASLPESPRKNKGEGSHREQEKNRSRRLKREWEGWGRKGTEKIFSLLEMESNQTNRQPRSNLVS